MALLALWLSVYKFGDQLLTSRKILTTIKFSLGRVWWFNFRWFFSLYFYVCAGPSSFISRLNSSVCYLTSSLRQYSVSETFYFDQVIKVNCSMHIVVNCEKGVVYQEVEKYTYWNCYTCKKYVYPSIYIYM